MADASKPYGQVMYADPGYQADKIARYPVDTKSHAKSAWSYINQADNAKAYTAAQLKRVKGRIMKALKKFGVSVAAEGWVLEPAVQVTEAIAEHYGMDPDQCGSWCINASNGPVNLSLSCYGMDPADLDVILRAAADAACKALAALDPDMDGDIDVPGAGAEDTDGDAGESADPADDATEAESVEVPPAPEPAAGETAERTESAMPETTPAAESTAAPTFTQADLDAAASAAAAKAVADFDAARRARKAARLAAAESAPAAPVAESAPAAPAAAAAPAAPAAPAAEAAPAAVQETEDQIIERMVNERLAAQFPAESDEDRISRIVQERFDAAVAQRVQTGQINVGRKGVVAAPGENTATGQVAESLNPATGLPTSWGGKQLHEMGQDEFDTRTGPVVVRHVLRERADRLA